MCERGCEGRWDSVHSDASEDLAYVWTVVHGDIPVGVVCHTYAAHAWRGFDELGMWAPAMTYEGLELLEESV